MIRFRCPQCEKKLAVNDARAGQVGSCPECEKKFRIPAAPAPADDAITTSPRRKPAPPDHEDSPLRRKPAPADDAITTRPRRKPAPPDDENLPPPRKRRRVDEDDDQESLSYEDEPEERPLPKRRKKKRKKSGTVFMGMDAVTLGLTGVGIFALLSLGLTFLVHDAVILPIGIGWLMMLAGGIWFLVLAFKDSPTHGILCMFLPFYSLYYLITRYEYVKQAFLTQLLGVFLLILGGCVGGLSAPAPSVEPGRPLPKFRSDQRIRGVELAEFHPNPPPLPVRLVLCRVEY